MPVLKRNKLACDMLNITADKLVPAESPDDLKIAHSDLAMARFLNPLKLVS